MNAFSQASKDTGHKILDKIIAQLESGNANDVDRKIEKLCKMVKAGAISACQLGNKEHDKLNTKIAEKYFKARDGLYLGLAELLLALAVSDREGEIGRLQCLSFMYRAKGILGGVKAPKLSLRSGDK